LSNRTPPTVSTIPPTYTSKKPDQSDTSHFRQVPTSLHERITKTLQQTANQCLHLSSPLHGRLLSRSRPGRRQSSNHASTPQPWITWHSGMPHSYVRCV